MSTTRLRTTQDTRGVLRIILDHPEVHNAFDEQLIAEITEAFAAIHANSAVRVVVLEATGRSFCAGADIEWMRRAAAKDQAGNLEDARCLAAMLDAIDQCPRPVIAKVQGAAYGGGVGLVAAVDWVVASERARFCLSEAKLGIIPAVIGPYLVNAIGVRDARRLALSTSLVEAPEALYLGLVHKVVTEAELDAEVERVIVEMLKGGPNAHEAIKTLFAQLQVGPVTHEVREMTASAISRIRATEEARQGFQAFIDKALPPWQA